MVNMIIISYPLYTGMAEYTSIFEHYCVKFGNYISHKLQSVSDDMFCVYLHDLFCVEIKCDLFGF